MICTKGTTGEDQQWGRFTVTWDQLYQVWHTTRHDGSTAHNQQPLMPPVEEQAEAEAPMRHPCMQGGLKFVP